MLQKRTITTDRPFRSKELSPGVFFESFYPGGINGPNGELHLPTPGGQSWTDLLLLGTKEDAFQLMLPDIRMPSNQYWPLHWHDCWTAVLVVEGECCIGDWWMKPGDIFITEPSIEYGPLLIGPKGCRLFEIFAQAHLSPGGYAPEYHDHPTLRLSPGRLFLERSELNKRNDGRQVLPCNGVDGITKTRLAPGAIWNLGQADDANRGVMKDTRLTPGERIDAQSYGDWHALLVMDGSLTIGGEVLVRDDYLRIRPNALVGEIEAGQDGVQLLEVARTTRSLVPLTMA